MDNTSATRVVRFTWPAVVLLAVLIGTTWPRAAGQGSQIPSLDSTSGSVSGSRPRSSGGPANLPSDAGQYWQTYDLSPYTKELKTVDRPHKAIVDWILRETGTDVWFTDPFGFINADRTTLRIYHTQAMHEAVQRVYERFVNGTTVPQLYGLRVMAVGSPNWRTRAHALMHAVPAQSPGVHAYVMTKENAAIFLAMMRGRADYREISSVDMVVHNGQSQTLSQVRGRNFIQNYQPVSDTWPPYLPVTGEIREGYRLELSPLLTVDRKLVDLVVKCEIDQIEKLIDVLLDLPLQNGQLYTAPIQVPQVSSWRLHERFRWPADHVLLLSCGVVASPTGKPDGTLLGMGSSVLGIDRLLAPGRDRADALLMIEYRGDAQGVVSAAAPAASTPRTATNPMSRGRY